VCVAGDLKILNSFFGWGNQGLNSGHWTCKTVLYYLSHTSSPLEVFKSKHSTCFSWFPTMQSRKERKTGGIVPPSESEKIKYSGKAESTLALDSHGY
jgi:hypothetical protein